MITKSPRAGLRSCLVEPLESRTLFSAVSVLHSAAAKAPTTTTTVQSSTHAAYLGQGVALTVTVKSSQPHTIPSGTVEFLDNGNVIEGLHGPLLESLNAKGKASYNFSAGSIALFVGQNNLSAKYLGNGTSLPESKAKAAGVDVVGLNFRKFSDGLETATVQNGKGKGVVAGDNIQVLYTGFLANSGGIFDYSSGHGAGQPTNFTFVVEANPEQVISGFDQGVQGMKVGETRVILIPAALGYGGEANGNIPADSELLFFVKLQKIIST